MATPLLTATISIRSHVLLVDGDDAISVFGPQLDQQFRVNATARVAVANEYIKRSPPALVVTALELSDGTGIDVCRAAKALPVPATVLVTATCAEQVPEALAIGCDSVLLKPFQTNLLVARVGRLMRERGERLQLERARTIGKSAHQHDRIELIRTGTNRVWPNTHCPYCAHPGATSFDFAAKRQAWYACLQCKKVWTARRQE